MATDMSAFVERYQLLYEKDPSSKVFAPLAEAYRRMGLLDEAIDLAERGVEQHPHFASGRVALGKCYVQKAMFFEGAEQLKIAADLSPENLLAHQLLAECYSRLKRPIEALEAYKIVLFLNPNDLRVAEIVRKLEAEFYAGQKESQAHEEREEIKEEYSMGPLKEVIEQKSETPSEEEEKPLLTSTVRIMSKELEQELALLDARYQRGDWVKVKEQLDELIQRHPDDPEVMGRKQYLDEITNNNYALAEWLVPVAPDAQTWKVDKLKDLLNRVETRRKALFF